MGAVKPPPNRRWTGPALLAPFTIETAIFVGLETSLCAARTVLAQAPRKQRQSASDEGRMLAAYSAAAAPALDVMSGVPSADRWGAIVDGLDALRDTLAEIGAPPPWPIVSKNCEAGQLPYVAATCGLAAYFLTVVMSSPAWDALPAAERQRIDGCFAGLGAMLLPAAGLNDQPHRATPAELAAGFAEFDRILRLHGWLPVFPLPGLMPGKRR